MVEEQSKSSTSSNPSDGTTKVEKVLEEFIRNDDKNGFVSFIRSFSEDGSFSHTENMPPLDEIMMWICCHSAEGCATSLLEGETGLPAVVVDDLINVPLPDGLYPLHHAARNLRSRLTDLCFCAMVLALICLVVLN
ncbi:OLC1v1038147C1 [Oldenlandia corymbosa var. corymbosa]|uniref:OLC1v1038147C1 n=1 Tax=Oldenlandia corymbosa var. corymbosa TaxID=529605 RepID=A0AAV1D0M4_OLDCO|nr:OLC1v1038147C1 [Oldenlandia corymbosa var. corymbosa]